MKKKQRKKKARQFKNTGKIILLMFFFFIALFIYKTNNFKNPLIENKEAEMRTLPIEVKKQIRSLSSSATFKVPILMYHYVEYVKDEKDTIRKSLDITPDVFEKQIKTFADEEYTFMTMNELADVLDGKWELPKKAVIFTFDDGYRDFYTDVFPILKKYNAKATVYVISGFIGKPNFMFSDQIEEILESGLVEVGAHTVNHAYLAGKSEDNIHYEVNKSKEMLSKQFKISVVSFAYPYGAFDQKAIKIVKDVGFRTSVSTIEGVLVNQDNRYFMYRIRPGLRTGKDLIDFTDSLAQPKSP